MEIVVGDIVRRRLAEATDHDIEVLEVSDRIYCRPRGSEWTKEMCWSFHLTTMYEIDDDLGWDGVTKSGSRLIGVLRRRV